MANEQNKEPTCKLYPLERRKIIKKTISGFMGLFFFYVLIGIYLFVYKINNFNLWMIYILSLVTFSLLILIYQIYYYKYYYYDIGSDLLVIKKGVIGRTEANTQYPRIQNVFVDQDILDRFFGLYDVHIITAGIEMGTTHPFNHIDGVNKQNAEAFRNLLLKKSKLASSSKQGI